MTDEPRATSTEIARLDVTIVDPGETDASSFGLLPRAALLAKTIAHTDFVKASLRGKPAAVAAAILTGHELGIGPMMALSRLNVIDGQVVLDAQGMRALVQSKGHEIFFTESTSTRCTAVGIRRGSSRETSVTWTLEDAKRAKLLDKQRSAWGTYPRAMLVARATSELCRMIFSDVLGGVAYSAEEIADGLGGLRDTSPDGEADAPEAELPPETPATTTRQAPARRRRSTTESSGDALPGPAAALGDEDARPGEVTAAAPAEVATSAGHGTDPASLVGRGAAPEPSPAPFPADTWAGLDVPGDDGHPPLSGPAAAPPATPPATPTAPQPPATGGAPDAPGDAMPPESSGAVPLDRAQEVAMWCRDAGLERDELCSAVSGGRTASARELTEPEAARALDLARAVARGDAVAQKSEGGRLVIRRLGDVELRDQVLGLLQTAMEKRRAATTEIIGRAGYVRGDGARGARVSTWAGALPREQQLELLAELRKAAPA